MLKKFSKTKLILLLTLVAALITTGAKCGGPPPGYDIGKPKPLTLTYWKVYEESYNIQDILGAYQKLHPEVSVEYRNFTPEEYEEQLLTALAADRGPDIFSVQTTWMRKYQENIAPLPATLTIPYAVESGGIKKETWTEYRKVKALTLREVQDYFPEVVYDNQVINDQIYGLPLSIDTLALFYNRDLLNNAGIANPPKTWESFKEDVVKLTKQDAKGNIIQAGAALGTADNIARASDIISLLMMQVGAPMTDESDRPAFNRNPVNYQGTTPPAFQALNFYLSFASPATQVYTWNEKMPNSLEAFTSGQVAFFLGYAYNLPIIKTRAPKLNFGIVPVPQVGNPFNMANYWAETVSKKSKHTDQAWDFLTFIATNKDMNKIFLDKSKKPAALRELITPQLDDLELWPFASQILTARSWYRGKDPTAMEQIMNTLINDLHNSSLPMEQIISLAISRLSQTY